MNEKDYPRWRQSYSGEDFGRTQQLAWRITEDARRQGGDAPPYGYSSEAFDLAYRVVKQAQY